MDVVKIRLQSGNNISQGQTYQYAYNKLTPELYTNIQPKYRNAPQTLITIVAEEGITALWRGGSLTALRQGSNQAASFTAYTEMKSLLLKYHASNSKTKGNPLITEIPSYQTTAIGLISGAIGPFANAPVDLVKTRLQQASGRVEGRMGIAAIVRDVWRREGLRGFWKGITPRVARVAPGQAVTFTVYEFLKKRLEKRRAF